MKFSVRFFSSLYISLLCASVSSNVLATQTEKPERWFEVEVILFKQLSDKKGLKEQFPDNISPTNLPQYKKYFDLLTSYIQPNLTNIKQFMPLCNENKTPQGFVESLSRIQTPFVNTIKAIEHVDGFSMPKFSTENEATAQYRERIFELQEELASPLFSTQNICIISHKDIENLFTGEQLANFKLDAFDVKALPTKLNVLGEHSSDSPYLIADESLLLADIKQRLEWSKEFKPLLHFGWRQIGVTRNKAIPLKLFAGKSLDYQYQQALNSYQSSLDEAKDEEQAEQLIFQQEINSATIQKEQNKSNYAETNQQQLTQIFNELDTLDSLNILDSVDINGLISELEQQEFEALIAINEVNMDESTQLRKSKAPVKPLQPWFLDGFFKVHLDHYLYVTANFNVLDQFFVKNTEHPSDKARVKLINFSQNKRVITGEIHYFDHPYIGMLVQIRRFDPSKPKEEAVTQVVN